MHVHRYFPLYDALTGGAFDLPESETWFQIMISKS